MLMMDYQEFLSKLQKRGSHPYRISHCLGSRDAFHWVRKNKWEALKGNTCDKLLYSQIISEIHKELAEMLLEGHEIELPYQMGSLVLNCVPARVSLREGEYVNNYKVDWKKTLQYLYEDEEALDNHKRVKRIQPFIYGIRYYKRKAHFLNRRFYWFSVNRQLRRRVGKIAESKRLCAEHTEY